MLGAYRPDFNLPNMLLGVKSFEKSIHRFEFVLDTICFIEWMCCEGN